ncbi:hypothetical protein D9611_005097 [Ephemerocybe angulata]|uniref:Methyltransferase domain-containing protein n=1 Tax=Ephemerocybe angulata TaxID=980116 RepID=A0A8H5C2H6_9AGAR|nr:hypothetical protein D9611_005097 [Tulosesus angulatus]
MGFTVTARPCSQNFGGPSASTPVPGFDYSPLRRPAVRSHYRPFSTIEVKPKEETLSPPTSHRNSVLSKARRHSTIYRSVSLGEAMGLGKKKATDSKDKAPALRIRKLSDISASTPPTEAKLSTKVVSRPSTSAGGLTVVGRNNTNGNSSALHRVKAQRSIGALFTAAADVSPNTAPLENHIRSKVASSTIPPSPLRTLKMDVAAGNRPRTPSNPRPRGHSKAADDKEKKQSDKFQSNEWLTRSRTRVHPFTKEVPYMQAYDIPCLDNDRYTQLLLERMNPGSPSFHDYGKKYPMSVLDLGCGQGDWCLFAASIWKHSRITGFDLMDVTLPAFQATENLNFVQGNFLVKLPFHAKSFEFVRMANLSLCIPYDAWMPLLAEVRRVLTNGGRLELIDDEMLFPYGEEPLIKETVLSETRAEAPKEIPLATEHAYPQTSFFDFASDSDRDSMESDDDDTIETMSTTSTLVSERDSMGFFGKSSKRSSAQSTASTSVGSERRWSDASMRRFSDAIPPLTISLTTLAENATSQPTISPSPTVTPATFHHILEDNENTISQSPTITERKHHKKTASASSTKSHSEAIVSWKTRRLAASEMEIIFEHVLLERYGIDPRPAEFICEHLSNVFGKGNSGKAKSFHIKLAPFDSPIGPGGALDPRNALIVSSPHKAEKKQKKEKWDGASGKKEKEKKRERRKLEKLDSAKGSLEELFQQPQPPVITAKAASRLGLIATAPPMQHRRNTTESSTSSDGDSPVSSKRSSSYHDPTTGAYVNLPVVTAKAASRLGIPVTPPPLPPKSEAIINSYIHTGPKRNSKEVKKPLDSTVRLVVQRQNSMINTAAAAEDPSPAPSISYRGADQIERNSSSSSSGSSGSDPESQSSSSSSEAVSSDGALMAPPPQLSAKAAGRLGISYSVLAAASAAHSRGSGVLAPVQSPGLLVWPSTYIPMSPEELEMHSCKWVQTLLGCRHAMREFITGKFEGMTLAEDPEFEEAIWDYECFRRSRFHWPNDNPELFGDNGFPESPGLDAPNPSQQQHQRLCKPGANGTDTVESFNGQYRRNDLTHVRTIRVFHAVKDVEDKSFVSMLFPNNGR